MATLIPKPVSAIAYHSLTYWILARTLLIIAYMFGLMLFFGAFLGVGEPVDHPEVERESSEAYYQNQALIHALPAASELSSAISGAAGTTIRETVRDAVRDFKDAIKSDPEFRDAVLQLKEKVKSDPELLNTAKTIRKMVTGSPAPSNETPANP